MKKMLRNKNLSENLLKKPPSIKTLWKKAIGRAVKYSCLLQLFVLSPVLYAQHVPMADSFRADGKIYVVVASILLLWTGFVVYLLRLGRKINRLSKKIHHHLRENERENTVKRSSEEDS